MADAGTYSIRQLIALMQAPYPGFGVHPSILRERGFRWKRTWYSLKKMQEQARDDLAVWTMAAGRDELDLAFSDESGLSVNPAPGYAWTRIGGLKAVFPQRHSRRFNVLGACCMANWRGRASGAGWMRRS